MVDLPLLADITANHPLAPFLRHSACTHACTVYYICVRLRLLRMDLLTLSLINSRKVFHHLVVAECLLITVTLIQTMNAIP